MLPTRLDGPAADPRVVEHYGWLREYREAVTGWLAEHELVRRTVGQLRRHGLHRGTPGELNRLWKGMGIRGRAGVRSLARSWCGYVKRYQPRAAGDRYAASTEVLESSFGTLKRVAHQQSDSGLTGWVPATGMIVGTRSEEQVRARLDATPQKVADRGQETWLGKTIQWLRRRLFAKPTT